MTWQLIKLKWVAATVAGGTPSVSEPTFWADDDEGIAWVSIGDMSERNVVRTTDRRVTEAGVRAARLPVADAGTLLLSMYASLGHTAYLKMRASWNQAILGIIPSPLYDKRLLKYSLESLKPQLGEFARSNTQANLNAEVVGNLDLPFPPMDEQRRIADFLDKETARLIEVTARQLRVRGLMYQRESVRLDAELDRLIARHGVAPLRRFIVGVEQGASPQCDNRPADEVEWGVLKVSCLRADEFYPEENKVLPTNIPPARRYQVREGDFLVSRANTPALVGVAAVVPPVRAKLLLPDKIFRIGVSSGLNTAYLACVARGGRVRGLCAATSHGASQSMANLRIEAVKAWPIPTAPRLAQEQLARSVRATKEQADTMARAIDAQLALLSERRQALVTAAVTGQIDVTTAGRAAEWAATGR